MTLPKETNTKDALEYELFPSDNDLEIPLLRLDMQPKAADIPFVGYGEQARTFKMEGKGTLHFYVDDYRFTAIWKDFAPILAHNPKNIVEPNFSLYAETPTAFGLQEIYKKRAIARKMQDLGYPVFVDLNVNHKFYKLNMLGVPRGYSAFCTRGYSERLPYLEFEWKLAKDWADGNPLLFVIFGGGAQCKQFACEHHCVYVTPMIIMKNYNKRFERRLTDEIALNFPDFEDTKTLVSKATEKTFQNQVYNYLPME